METGKDIVREGVVQSVNERVAFVSVTRMPACSGCSAKSSCTGGSCDESEVLVIPLNGKEFNTGERVLVSLSKSAALQTAVLTYLVPMSLMVTILVVLLHLHVSESIAGLVSVAILVPYFLWLSWLSRRMGKHLTFNISRK